MGRTFVFGKQGKTRKTGKNNVDYQCKVFIGFSDFYLFYKKLSIHTKSCRTVLSMLLTIIKTTLHGNLLIVS